MSCERRGVCICHDPHPVEVRDNLEKLPLFFYRGVWGLNSSHRAWQQMSFPTEPSCKDLIISL